MNKLEEIKERTATERRIAVSLLCNEDIDWLISEIERLKKEKKWLIDECVEGRRSYNRYKVITEHKEDIIKEMQRALTLNKGELK